MMDLYKSENSTQRQDATPSPEDPSPLTQQQQQDQQQLNESSNNSNCGGISIEEEQNDRRGKKRRVRKACVYCNRSHMSCENARPCKRCVSRGIAHLCRDTEAPRRRGRKGAYLDDGRYGKDEDENAEESVIDRVSIPSLMSNPVPSVFAHVSLENQPPISNTPSFVQTPDISLLQNEVDLPLDLRSMLSDLLFFDTNSYQSLSVVRDDELLTKLLAVLRVGFKELGEEVDKMVINLRNARKKITMFIKEKFKIAFDWHKSLDDMKSEIDALVTVYRTTFDALAIPMIVWDRSGVIYYVSPAFRLLLGFIEPLPTKKEEFILWRLFSTEGFKVYTKCATQVLSGYPDNNDNFFLTNSGFRKNFSSPQESIVEGTLSLTIRRDPLGLPFLVLGCFLPKVSTTITFK